MIVRPQKTEQLVTVLKAVATAVDSVIGILPEKWATKVRSARKTIAGGAGALLSMLTALTVFPLDPSIAPWVGLAVAACTTVVTYWVPNGEV